MPLGPHRAASLLDWDSRARAADPDALRDFDFRDGYRTLAADGPRQPMRTWRMQSRRHSPDGSRTGLIATGKQRVGPVPGDRSVDLNTWRIGGFGCRLTSRYCNSFLVTNNYLTYILMMVICNTCYLYTLISELRGRTPRQGQPAARGNAPAKRQRKQTSSGSQSRAS